ncbi:carbohydrate diacid regulator [Pseudomonas duriflava]|uniref:Carbohydrate diacid regulator n=1 Tax=Pseudomonas duriflava TaxID=459528 RepID=A0A562Q8J8_9PSED|nr:sugar diacid recognition domain-containing protein [Pseudomonas duriflava]TWI53063.1 carbohydrate diacid regulator [Pseudomonas duriflava]
MIELDSTLAQHIVDRAMAILPYNINVMDAQGMIIGSGDPQRLHTRHEGAQLVLANSRIVEIDERTASCLRGVRPGVNMPLLYAERLIGVLGITGVPEVVRPYAELVRMAAEMLVEQRQAHRERHWQGHRLDKWIAQLLDPSVPFNTLAAEAERQQVPLGWPRQVCLIELDEASDARPDKPLSALLSFQADSFCAPIGVKEWFWCRPYHPQADDLLWLSQAEARGWKLARLTVSGALETLADLREACQALRLLQSYGRACLPATQVLRLEEHRLTTLLYSQRQSWLLQGWLEPLKRLFAQDEQGVLRSTLHAWCMHHGQASACAAFLHIHRNTLRYRLERICELSGLDPSMLGQWLYLSLGMSLLECDS